MMAYLVIATVLLPEAWWKKKIRGGTNFVVGRLPTKLDGLYNVRFHYQRLVAIVRRFAWKKNSSWNILELKQYF